MPYRLPHPEAKPPALTASSVPKALRHLIGLAEKYGVSDDGYRDEVIYGLDGGERDELVRFLAETPQDLWDWLAGPESYDSPPTPEYVAFSCLVMAAELAKANDQHRS